MAESLVGAVVKLLGSVAWNEVEQLKRFHPDFDDMKEKLVEISAVLRDTENRSSTHQESKTTELWLQKLMSIAYDIQDMLGDYHANTGKRSPGEKIKQLFSSASNPWLVKHATADAIKELKRRLDEVARDPLVKKFEKIAAPEEMHVKYERFVPENANDIVGRDADILNIMLHLHSAKDGVPILPIVALGGVGKSTIARIIFDEAQGFDQKIWVTVTRNFSWNRIAKAILEERNKMELPQEDNLLIELIKEKLQSKKCMLVLDDLWEDKSASDVLKQLKQMLQNYTGQGSQAIVTTRSNIVARAMCNITPQYELKNLTDDDCWVLFSRRAFMLFPENRSQREEVGKEIVKKCGGLPLGALSVGSIMSRKKDIKEWEAVKNSELWSLEDKCPNQEERVAPSIKLSYYYMPQEWRLCFQYCAVFPKGFNINRQNLIEQWVALDMVGADKAEEYLSGLTSIYFLQISKSSYGIGGPHVLKRRNKPEVLGMHDMVHEVAKSAGGDFILNANASDPKATLHATNTICRYVLLSNYYDHKEEKNSEYLPPKTRALHLTNSKVGSVPVKGAKYMRVLHFTECSAEDFPTSVCDLKYLRYLDASSTPIKQFTGECPELPNLLFLNLSNTSLELLPSEFYKLRKLISLNLSCCRHLKELPDDLGGNSEIQFLDLSDSTLIQSLPQSICMLTKLESLNLSNCERLQRLPDSFGNLTSLEHLDLSGCSDLEQLPESFGQLPNLILLDLSNCSHLQGLPEISNGGFKKLRHLYLSRCPILKKFPTRYYFDTIPLETMDLEDCYNLEDGPNIFPCTLISLDISNCKSMDINARSFEKLKKLKTLRLKSCQLNNSAVESLGILTELEFLDLSGAKLKRIPESFGELVKLETLYLYGDQLFGIYKDKCFSEETIAKMVSLKNVWALDPALASKVPADKLRGSLFDTVKDITKYTVYQRICGLSARSNGEEIAEREKIQKRSDVNSLNLEWIDSRDDEPNACESVLKELQPHQNLQSFTLMKYPGYGFPVWIQNSGSYLPNLTSIALYELRNCAHLPPFGELPNLEILILTGMPKLTEVTMDICGQNKRPFRKLVVLILLKMENLEKWQTSNNIHGVPKYMFPVLWNLKVEYCPKLRFTPSIPKCMEYGIVNSDMVLEKVEGTNQFPSHAELQGPLTCPSPYLLTISGGRTSLNGWEQVLSLHTVQELEILPPKRVKGFFPPMSDGLPESIRSLINLKRLHLSYCKNFPDWLGDFAKLEMLTLEHCYFVRPLRQSLEKHNSLETLVITSCSGLVSESIPFLPSLRAVVIQVCKDLTTLPVCLAQATQLEVLNIIDCPKLRYIPLELQKHETSGVLTFTTSNPKEEMANLRKTGWMTQIYTPLASHDEEEGTGAHAGRTNDAERDSILKSKLFRMARSYSRGEDGTSADQGIHNHQDEDRTSHIMNQMFRRMPSSRRMDEGTSRADGATTREEEDIAAMHLLLSLATYASLQDTARQS